MHSVHSNFNQQEQTSCWTPIMGNKLYIFHLFLNLTTTMLSGYIIFYNLQVKIKPRKILN